MFEFFVSISSSILFNCKFRLLVVNRCCTHRCHSVLRMKKIISTSAERMSLRAATHTRWVLLWDIFWGLMMCCQRLEHTGKSMCCARHTPVPANPTPKKKPIYFKHKKLPTMPNQGRSRCMSQGPTSETRAGTHISKQSHTHADITIKYWPKTFSGNFSGDETSSALVFERSGSDASIVFLTTPVFNCGSK